MVLNANSRISLLMEEKKPYPRGPWEQRLCRVRMRRRSPKFSSSTSAARTSSCWLPRRIPSGPTMTAGKMVCEVKACVRDWKFDRVSLGYPGPIINGHPLREPHNLGGGWMRFNFSKAFGCPVKILNDAAMQALGSYKGGRMLFLGLGTGLGSAMIVDGMLQPMELAHLSYKNGKTYEDYHGERDL